MWWNPDFSSPSFLLLPFQNYPPFLTNFCSPQWLHCNMTSVVSSISNVTSGRFEDRLFEISGDISQYLYTSHTDKRFRKIITKNASNIHAPHVVRMFCLQMSTQASFCQKYEQTSHWIVAISIALYSCHSKAVVFLLQPG